MNQEHRIKLEDSFEDVIIKLTEGNPGAIRVCFTLLDRGSLIDPSNTLGGIAYLINLDECGVYGHRIWMLYKDICGMNINATCALIRGWQLGIVSDFMAVKPEEVNGILNKVKERLPDFNIQ